MNSMKPEQAGSGGIPGVSGAISRKTAPAHQLVKVLEHIVESLKAKNSPEVVNFRSVERTKITNFLKKYLRL